jgi:hypothetical protein
MATTGKIGGLVPGFALLGASLALIVAGCAIAFATPDLVARAIVLGVTGAFLVALWGRAVRNARAEGRARVRIEQANPGAFVERVRLWSLPQGRVDRGTPPHFLIADAEHIVFQTIDDTALLKVDVADLGYVGLVRAQGDTARDQAITLIYGDDDLTVQFFGRAETRTEGLLQRVTRAIAWEGDHTAP